MPRFKTGHVKLYRSILHSDIMQNSALCQIWVALLSMATYVETTALLDGEQVKLPPGSVVYGVRELAEKLNIGKSTVHKWIKYLHKTGRVADTTRTQGSHLTICNWNEYQFSKDTPRTQSGQDADKPRTRGGQAPDRIQELKKERKDLPEKFTASDSQLEEVFNLYPKRNGGQEKAEGFKRLKLQLTSLEDFELCKRAAKGYAAYIRSTDKEGTIFVKMFASWANERWREWVNNDALPKPPKDKTLEDMLKEG